MKEPSVKTTNGAWRLQPSARWSLVLLGSALFAACGSDAQHLPPSNGDGGTSSGGAAGRSAGHAGSSGSGEAGAAGAAGSDESMNNAGAAGMADGGAENGGQAQGGGGSGGTSSNGPPSCQGSTQKCGSDLESCCTSLTVPGQTFLRSYDAVTPEFKDSTYPAAITTFRLDKFEVTVGRFRRFVAAVVGAWRPGAGEGKHAHLSNGDGLKNVGATGGSEPGWDIKWNQQLATKAATWNTNLECDQASASWTPDAGGKELWPISCVNWYEAYAFCIWDGGFLPSEAEWNDAASGGDKQRTYPWSIPPTTTNIDCSHANYFGRDNAGELDFCATPGTGSVAPVGSYPLGDALWGHADLAGNVYEWTLDSFGDYTHACPDCTNAETLTDKVMRGGGYANAADAMLVSQRFSNTPLARSNSLGIRCARAPE